MQTTDIQIRNRNIGHAAVCEWHEAHPETGKRWQDMWGGNEDVKKLNFFLYRRGILEGRTPWGYRSARGGFTRNTHRAMKGMPHAPENL